MRIATKTVLVFTAFAVFCVGLTGVVLLEQARDGFEQAIVDRQRLLTENRAMVLRDNLQLAMGELVRLSRMADIDLRDGDPRPEQRLLAQAYRQTSFFNGSLKLIGVNGQCYWAEPHTARCAGRSFGREAWFGEALVGREPSLLYRSEPDGTGLVDLVVPVVREDEVVALLLGVVDLQRDRLFSPALRADLPPATRAALVSRDGSVVYRSPGIDLTRAGWSEALSGLHGGRAGSGLVRLGGVPVLLSWAPVGQSDLGLVFGWPWDSLDDTSEALVRNLLGLVAAMGLLSVALGSIAAGRLTRPVRQLAEHVRRAELDRVLIPPPSTRDEVGELHRAFSGLLETLSEREAQLRADRDRISELAEGLERRVDERTAELRETQEALVQAERLAAVGRAGAVLSHELRNSLNAISVAMDTFGGEPRGTGKLQRDAQHLVRSEVARLRTLSDDLLTFAREPVLRLREVSVQKLLETALLLVEDYAEQLRVTLELRIAPGVETARLDTDRMQSVLVNLLRNAIEAAAERPDEAAAERPDDATAEPAGVQRRVALMAHAVGSSLVLGVEDSGAGVSADVTERLFQPFVTSRHAGVGLGLAIADRFVRAHGGRLQLTTGSLGGACFLTEVPIDGPSPDAQSPP